MVKNILNIGERAVYEITKQVAESAEIEVFAKTRVADVLEIDRSGISNAHYSYALKAHFDFLVARLGAPLMAIEFDGPGHDSTYDHLKNELCDRFHLPLVRVTLEHVNARNFQDSAVHFLVYQLLCLEDFYREVSDPYEVYDPSFMISVPGRKGLFPFAYPNRWRGRLERRFKEHLDRLGDDIRDIYAHGLVNLCAREGAWVKGGAMRALCAQDVGNDKTILGTAELGFAVYGMDEKRRHDFMAVHPFVMGLAAGEMYEDVIAFLLGADEKAIPISQVNMLPGKWVNDGYQLKLALNLSSGH